MVFNNTTSLPLLLIQSLDPTGTLSSLLMPEEDTAAAASLARSYFLVSAVVPNTLMFGIGQKLLGPHDEDAPTKP